MDLDILGPIFAFYMSVVLIVSLIVDSHKAKKAKKPLSTDSTHYKETIKSFWEK